MQSGHRTMAIKRGLLFFSSNYTRTKINPSPPTFYTLIRERAVFGLRTVQHKNYQASLKLHKTHWLTQVDHITLSSTRHLGNENHPASKKYPLHDKLTECKNIFTIPRGVQIFYISEDSSVKSPFEPSPLSIVQLPEERSKETPPAFLQVGDWVYPLVPGMSPAMVTDYGAYLFPDTTAGTEGSHVAVVLPDDIPETEREKFENVLRHYTVQETELTPQVDRSPSDEASKTTPVGIDKHVSTFASLVSKAIALAAAVVAMMIKLKTMLIGYVIKYGSSGVRSLVPPAERSATVDDRVHQGAIYAKQAATGAVMVTTYLVDKLGKGSVELAKIMEPHLREQGGKVVPETLQTPTVRAAYEGAAKVTSSTFRGMGTVYTSMADASKTLLHNLGDETVQIVQHRYGEEAGSFTKDTVDTLKGAHEATLQSKRLAMKKLLKNTAKSTGKAIIHETAAHSKFSDSSQSIPNLSIDSEHFLESLKKATSARSGNEPKDHHTDGRKIEDKHGQDGHTSRTQ